LRKAVVEGKASVPSQAGKVNWCTGWNASIQVSNQNVKGLSAGNCRKSETLRGKHTEEGPKSGRLKGQPIKKSGLGNH
jgi:hypothetical protein